MIQGMDSQTFNMSVINKDEIPELMKKYPLARFIAIQNNIVFECFPRDRKKRQAFTEKLERLKRKAKTFLRETFL